MSAMFAPLEGGGLANLDHVVSIDSCRRAHMSDGRLLQLADSWTDGEEHVEFSCDADLICVLSRIEDCLTQIRCSM